ENALEQTRRQYGMFVTGYVIMPEHIHLLVGEPERATLATALQALKQSVARRLIGDREHFWEARYYDFNVWSKSKRTEKLRYVHRNPVKRGLVEKPEDWPWSSLRHYATGVVEIESEWTARRRERAGQTLTLDARSSESAQTKSPPKQNRLGRGTLLSFLPNENSRRASRYVCPVTDRCMDEKGALPAQKRQGRLPAII
ncbi:MAG: transposase, partial [Candidatus Korobacteraceae bacterium]